MMTLPECPEVLWVQRHLEEIERRSNMLSSYLSDIVACKNDAQFQSFGAQHLISLAEDALALEPSHKYLILKSGLSGDNQ